MSVPRGLSFDDLKTLHDDLRVQSEHNATLVSDWIFSFKRRVDALIDRRREPPDAEVSLFWIRLHGVLVELPNEFRSIVAMVKSLSPEFIAKQRETPEGQTGLALLAHGWGIHLVAEEFSSALTRDEHIYADWRRQSEVHLKQTGYQIWIRKKGDDHQLRDGRTVASLKEMVPIADQWEAIRRIERDHYADPSRAAAEFATKLRPLCDKLVLAQSGWLEVARLPA